MIRSPEIAWLAGLLEGEGTHVYARTPPPPRKPIWRADQVKGATAAGWAMTLYPWLGLRRRQQVRDALAHWRRQGNGAINTGLAGAILAYRAARLSQAEIMALLRVSKSTVYRCTRSRLPRMRVTRQQRAARPAIGPIAATPS